MLALDLTPPNLIYIPKLHQKLESDDEGTQQTGNAEGDGAENLPPTKVPLQCQMSLGVEQIILVEKRASTSGFPPRICAGGLLPPCHVSWKLMFIPRNGKIEGLGWDTKLRMGSMLEKLVGGGYEMNPGIQDTENSTGFFLERG